MSALSGSARKRGLWNSLHRGGDSRDRTGDLLLARQALSQLSYIPLSPRLAPSKLNNVTTSAPADQDVTAPFSDADFSLERR